MLSLYYNCHISPFCAVQLVPTPTQGGRRVVASSRGAYLASCEQIEHSNTTTTTTTTTTSPTTTNNNDNNNNPTTTNNSNTHTITCTITQTNIQRKQYSPSSQVSGERVNIVTPVALLRVCVFMTAGTMALYNVDLC